LVSASAVELKVGRNVGVLRGIGGCGVSVKAEVAEAARGIVMVSVALSVTAGDELSQPASKNPIKNKV